VLIVTASTAVEPPVNRAIVLTKPFTVSGFDDAVERALGGMSLSESLS
jgi:hypothetical protein